ncbi:acyl carrier protein [Bradyrhizobium sp. LB1.3]|jgi:acyl carrier protein|uniref:acyl carrier protein n=1 Tax=unclassified Bradyrhizobium TaxID=2631580 RepID=UPI001FFB3129|nr:acyl carrier protein [Bradyrhizobium sp. 197]MCK1475707.1 acyl carrier protein [Bradyrhizobium sp. 197]
MKQAEVLVKLQELFDGIFLEKVVARPELSAADVEEWDSLMQISLVIAVEQKFRVRFRVGEAETARNLGEFADLIAKRIEPKS